MSIKTNYNFKGIEVKDAIIRLSNKETQDLLKTDHRNIKTIFKRLRVEPTTYNVLKPSIHKYFPC